MDYCIYFVDNELTVYNETLVIIGNVANTMTDYTNIDNVYNTHITPKRVISKIDHILITEKGIAFSGEEVIQLPSRAIALDGNCIECRDGKYYTENGRYVRNKDPDLLCVFLHKHCIMSFATRCLFYGPLFVTSFSEPIKQVICFGEIYWVLTERGKIYHSSSPNESVGYDYDIVKRIIRPPYYNSYILYETIDGIYRECYFRSGFGITTLLLKANISS